LKQTNILYVLRAFLINTAGLLIDYVFNALNKRKMAKKKKDLNINIDTKNVDVHITRIDGELNAELDTKNIDVKVRKRKGEKLDLDVETTPEFGEKIIKAVGIAIRNIAKRRG
jgi:hypothetical protein